MALDQEIAGSEQGVVHRLMARFRAFMARHIILLLLYRALVVTLGFIFLLLGIIMLVTPGPGWLFIFLGMGVWGTEFHWAHRLNTWAKAKVLATWRSLAARTERRRSKKQNARWSKFGRSVHYCPTGAHYHE